MKPAETDVSTPGPANASGDFSLIVGGPLYQLLLKTRLARSPLGLVHRRMLVIPALAWLPLLALTLLEGRALGGVTMPFLRDIEAYARFLVAIPILLAAELVVHQKMQRIIEQFRERHIVQAAALPRFEAALGSAMRWRNSLAVEVLLLALVFVLGPWVWKNGLALQTDTWYASVTGDGVHPTMAGWWFVLVSAPFFQFLLLRWYFRMAIWWRLAWQVSRLPLDLVSLHPDRAGGIGFLGGSIVAFTPVLFAQSVVLSGMVFSRVLTGAASAMDFRGEIALLVVFLVAQIMVPLVFFAPRLIAARNAAVRKFGLFATTYARDFHRKWLQPGQPVRDTPLGDADIQSLADLSGSYDIAREMRSVPFDARMLLRLLIATSIPFVPLVLTVIPFADLVQRLAAMLL